MESPGTSSPDFSFADAKSSFWLKSRNAGPYSACPPYSRPAIISKEVSPDWILMRRTSWTSTRDGGTADVSTGTVMRGTGATGAGKGFDGSSPLTVRTSLTAGGAGAFGVQ